MDESTHNRYFRDINNNRDENIHWDASNAVRHFSLATAEYYEKRLETIINSYCEHVESLMDLYNDEKGKLPRGF